MSTSTTTSKSVQLPSARVLIGSVYAICVLGIIAVLVGEILFTDHDPYSSEGPVNSIISISIIGTAALAMGLGLLAWSRRDPDRPRVAAIALAAFAVLTVVFFWSGAPGIFGACAAACAGLTRDGRPLSGAPRVAGIIGAFLALLNVLLTIGGVLLEPLVG
jgi:hypothetical protein